MTALTSETEFSGTCGTCGRACRYRPLTPRTRPAAHGRSTAYTPTLPELNVTCGQCGARVTLTAELAEHAAQ